MVHADSRLLRSTNRSQNFIRSSTRPPTLDHFRVQNTFVAIRRPPRSSQIYSSSDENGLVSSQSSDEASSASADKQSLGGRAEGIKLARRTLQVTFTCNKCGERTARLVNPLAWEKGLIFAQCKGCEVWHKLRDNEGLVDEIRYTD